MSRYEVAWQVFGVRTVEADSDEGALEAAQEWLDDDVPSLAFVVDGVDFRIESGPHEVNP